MRIELIPGIASISGTMKKNADGSRLEFRTFQRPDGKSVTRAYMMPPKERSTPVTAKELIQRQRFADVSAEVTRRKNLGDTRPRGEIFKAIYAEWYTNPSETGAERG